MMAKDDFLSGKGNLPIRVKDNEAAGGRNSPVDGVPVGKRYEFAAGGGRP